MLGAQRHALCALRSALLRLAPCAMPYAPCAPMKRSLMLHCTHTTQSCNRSGQIPGVLSTVAWWLATVAWAGLIFYLSTPAFGAHRSLPLIARLLALFDLTLSHARLGVLHSFVRTLAHITEYAILAILLYRSCHGRDRCGWSPRLAFWCVGIAGLYSVTDEYHQSFTPTRAASALDCFVDITGAVVAMLLVYFTVRFSSRRTSPNSKGSFDRHDAKVALIGDAQKVGTFGNATVLARIIHESLIPPSPAPSPIEGEGPNS